MDTAELKVHLPKDDLEFAERYAKEHQMTITELIDRYLRRLRTGPRVPLHPDVEKISGLVPPDIDAEALYRKHLIEKHK